jgi:hypothetical protein
VSDKYCSLIAACELEIARYRKEIISLQNEAKEHTFNLRLARAETEVQQSTKRELVLELALLRQQMSTNALQLTHREKECDELRQNLNDVNRTLKRKETGCFSTPPVIVSPSFIPPCVEYEEAVSIMCPVCMDSFDEETRTAKVMPCGHTLCTPCMERIKEVPVTEGQASHGIIRCPLCQTRNPEDQQIVNWVVMQHNTATVSKRQRLL